MNNLEFEKIIEDHIAKYKEMEIEDLFKLIYQSAYGSEHLVTDYETVERKIQEEVDGNFFREIKFEKISDKYSRVYFGVFNFDLKVSTLAKLFYLSSETEGNGLNDLKEKVEILKKMAKDKKLPFEYDLVCKKIDEWKDKGYTSLNHTKKYHALYGPSYRVINNKYVDIIPILNLIDGCDNVTLAIEGHAASGKSSLGKMLSEIYDLNLFHTDDFFLQEDQRTDERLKEVGGNFDRERFYKEIVTPLKKKESIIYRRFDCKTMTLSEGEFVNKKNINIIEGAYSLHPELGKYYDRSVFLDVEPDTQKKRILERNDEASAKKFFDTWIPKENEYFEKFDIKNKCDIITKFGE